MPLGPQIGVAIAVAVVVRQDLWYQVPGTGKSSYIGLYLLAAPVVDGLCQGGALVGLSSLVCICHLHSRAGIRRERFCCAQRDPLPTCAR